MSQYLFKNFPFVNYNGNLQRNIILKANFLQNIINSYNSFYPYVIKDGERADTIAYNYYGDSNYYWLVYLSNQLVDPYFEWPMTNLQFDSYINKKYGSMVAAMSTIDHYVYTPQPNLADNESLYNTNYIMLPTTYNQLVSEYGSKTDMNDFNPSEWIAVSAYDNEFQKNEDNRTINLISKIYLGQIESEISKIFK